MLLFVSCFSIECLFVKFAVWTLKRKNKFKASFVLGRLENGHCILKLLKEKNGENLEKVSKILCKTFFKEQWILFLIKGTSGQP